MFDIINKAVKITFYRFIILLGILFLPKAIATSPIDYTLSFSTYIQDLSFQETGQKITFNEEAGAIKGVGLMLNLPFKSWRAEISANYANGTINYYGRSQLGQPVISDTEITDSTYQLLLAKELYRFESRTCKYCGLWEGYLAGKYFKTNRDIYSQGNIQGLNEVYILPMIELGLFWRVIDISPFEFKVKISRSQAIDAKLQVNFLSTYDPSEISLNAVYRNQVEFSADYTFSFPLKLTIYLNYSDSTIDKSDSFSLFSQEKIVGEFYQPRRTRQSKTLGLQFSVNF